MKKFLILASTFLISIAYSQVGINTENPKATLEVVALPNDRAIVDGVIPPRLKGDEIKLKGNLYNANQNGAIIYITEPVTVPIDKTSNITSAGYYYYDSNISKWIPMYTSTLNGLSKINEKIELGGTLRRETIINGINATNSLKFQSTTGVNAINLGNNILSIDATNKRVGINNIAPTTSLDVSGNVKISELQENNINSDKVVTINTAGILKKVDPKIFYNDIDQTINFRAAPSNYVATGDEDVIWMAGANNTLSFSAPTDVQVRRGRVIHIVAAGSDISFTNYKPVVVNANVLTKLTYGNRISIVPVNVYGGKAWYVLSASQEYTTSSVDVAHQ